MRGDKGGERGEDKLIREEELIRERGLIREGKLREGGLIRGEGELIREKEWAGPVGHGTNVLLILAG